MADYMNHESFRELMDSFVRRYHDELEKAIYLGTTSSTETWWGNGKVVEEMLDDVQTVEFE